MTSQRWSSSLPSRTATIEVSVSVRNPSDRRLFSPAFRKFSPNSESTPSLQTGNSGRRLCARLGFTSSWSNWRSSVSRTRLFSDIYKPWGAPTNFCSSSSKQGVQIMKRIETFCLRSRLVSASGPTKPASQTHSAIQRLALRTRRRLAASLRDSRTLRRSATLDPATRRRRRFEHCGGIDRRGLSHRRPNR
jgi:hypothetical protein